MDKGNFSDYICRLTSIYDQILKRGKDLYKLVSLHNDCEYVVVLPKKEREKDGKGREIPDKKDERELSSRFRYLSWGRLIPFTGEAVDKVLNLEQIAKNKVSVVYEDDDEVHCT